MIKYTSSVEVVAHRDGHKVGIAGLQIKVSPPGVGPGGREPVFQGDQNAAVALRDALNDAITRARLIGEL